jgi:protein O-mannosyl-transferase
MKAAARVSARWAASIGSLAPLAVLVAVTFVAYSPVIRGGWIWDDDYYVTHNATLRSAQGLWRIWTDIGSVPQYYPLTHTAFWLEWRLWGPEPTGYRVGNVLLHCANAALIGVILRRLAVPGWWIVPWLFALHPVHVESVAWVTERKNVLSGFFYLLALNQYLKTTAAQPESSSERAARPFSEEAIPERGTPPERGTLLLLTPVPVPERGTLLLLTPRYFAALALFVCALLSKTVTSSLPAVVLLIVYWKRGRIAWRDVWPLLPFLALGAGMGLLTSWMERHVVGAAGSEFALSFVDRFLIAGRAVWFYVTKLLWPNPLIFMYPRWTVDPARLWQFAFSIAAVGLIASLWALRHRFGRGPLVAALFFGGSLFPALGFVNVLPMRYSFVADHFQYLASAGVLTLLAGVVAVRASRQGARTFTAVACLALAIVTWNHAHDFRDIETLWRSTLAKNPSSWMAHNNLGIALMNRGDNAAAAQEFRAAIAWKPDHDQARLNLGMIAERAGRFDEARAWYLDALRVKPNFANAHYNLGRLAATQGVTDDAIDHYQRAIEFDPKHDEAMTNLGVLFAERGDAGRAVLLYRRALEVNPASVAAHVNLGNVYLNANQFDAALAEWAKAAALSPRNPVVPNNIGVVLLAQGKLDEAERRFRESLAARPDYVDALINLGAVRARRGDVTGARQHLSKALDLDPRNEKARKQLDALNAR